MENLDGTVIATAMPQIARSFDASPVDLNIGMTAHLLALTLCTSNTCKPRWIR